MPDVTSGTDYNKLLEVLNDSIGWGTGNNTRTARGLNRGYKRFLHPKPQDRSGVSHEWTFLRPILTLEVKADQRDYDLPSNFGRLDGDIYYAHDNWAYYPIRQVSQGRMFELQQYPWSGESTYWPHFASIEPVIPEHNTTQQRWRMQVWPTPNQTYSLKFRYHALQDDLGVDNLYPLGGAAHSDTIEVACLHSLHQFYDDDYQNHWAEDFENRLAASISYDRKLSPTTHGRMVDGSDGLHGEYYQADFIQYNGVVP